MSHAKFKKLLRRHGGPRTQHGALCWRLHGGRCEILLVTSRRTGRWVIPKGWPEPGESPRATALREAVEEAGVDGKVSSVCLGLYDYVKHPDLADPLPCVVTVYAVKVAGLRPSWPEQSERHRKWFSVKKAATVVYEKELGRLLKGFRPKLLKASPVRETD